MRAQEGICHHHECHPGNVLSEEKIYMLGYAVYSTWLPAQTWCLHINTMSHTAKQEREKSLPCQCSMQEGKGKERKSGVKEEGRAAVREAEGEGKVGRPRKRAASEAGHGVQSMRPPGRKAAAVSMEESPPAP